MKKILFIFAFLLLPYSASAYSYLRTPSGSSIENPVSIVIEDFDATNPTIWNGDVPSYFQLYIEGDNWYEMGGNCYIPDIANDINDTFNLNLINYYVVSAVGYDNLTDCQNEIQEDDGNLIFQNVISELQSPTYNFEGDGVSIIFTVSILESENPFSLLVNEGDTVMTTVTGENMGANVAYAGNTFYKPFMGMGLSILYYLRYWIVALIIISLITFFYKRIKNTV